MFSVLVCAAGLVGCKASQLTGGGNSISVLYDEPVGCENLGVVIGRGGGLTGAYSKPSVNEQSAENDARNQAAELGATHLLLHPEEVDQGDGRGPDYQDTQPAMAHGSGTGSTITVAATAYKCDVAVPQTKTEVAMQGGSVFATTAAVTTISMAPLGTLESVSVYHRAAQAGGGIAETELLVVDDEAKIQAVNGSLQQAVEDPMKFIPTHRVEFRGDLGIQSLLYGFGYLQYAGAVFRLTDGVFEEELGLVETPKGPDVETEPPIETTSGGEAP